ncbi:MAG: hypothetical protein HY260_21430 [Chloroflexi bacterium]|nr:hypothetical protein [Chloroflexota bacterium]
MMTTLDKVRLFERYLELTQGNADRTLDAVLDKLLERKRSELARHHEEMRAELVAFEKQYAMASSVFFDKFERGELGDAIDFFDWSATWQMYNNVLKYLHALSSEPAAT